MRRVAFSAACATGAAMLLFSATPSSAQQPAGRALGEAHLLPTAEWEWAIGRWEEHLLTAAGSMGWTRSPRLLRMDKDGGGNVTSRFLFIPPPSDLYPPSSAIPSDAGLAKRCVTGPNGIS